MHAAFRWVRGEQVLEQENCQRLEALDGSLEVSRACHCEVLRERKWL
jgi:hypothetical protein